MTDETRLGPFVVERELGRGGMGVVYAARHEGRRVAVKVSIDDLPDRDRKHFLQEAELLSRISHPAVIEILDSGALEDGRPYLVMPLLEGKTLGERLMAGRLDPDLALRLFAQLAGAVATLHEAGIVHRDIKPENVMYIEDEERLVLLDFGIARDLDRPASTTTRMNLVRGTPGCMAPERFFGTRASASSDVYELGVVLYAMLVGQLPWEEPTDPEARLRPRHPSELGVDLPVGLGHILLEALSTRPDRRPSARELAVRVRSVEGAPLTPNFRARTTAALPALVPMESPPPRARTLPPPSDEKPRREVPTPVWIAGAVVVTALALGTSLSVRARRASAATYAHAGLGKQALSASIGLHLDAAGAGPQGALTVAAPATEPSTEPAARAAPSTASTTSPVATTTPAPTPAPAPAVPGHPWCTKMTELYCSPTIRRRPDGDAQCQARRADLAKLNNLPDKTVARAEGQCRDAIPDLERNLRASQGSEAPEDLPMCKRVVAVYCSPEVKNSYGGDGLCAQAQRAWGTRLASLPPADRAASNAQCSQLLPAATQAMRQHVRDLGPGTAASARIAAAAQGAAAPGSPPAPPAAPRPAPTPGAATPSSPASTVP